jgi:hypothetical protein
VEWAKGKVRHDLAEILRKQEVNGESLLTLTKDDLMKSGFPLGPAASLALAIEGLKKQKVSTIDQQQGQQLLAAILEGKFEVKEAKFTDSKGKEGSLTYIKLADGVPWLLEESSILFERQCDKDLFNIISDIEKPGKALQGVVVTGNPGIGKSWFLMYLLYRFVLEKRTIVYHHAKKNQGWLFRSDGSVLYFDANESWPVEVKNALKDARTIYLFDPAGKGEPYTTNAFTVVASSPDPENFKNTLKDVANKRFMSCWYEEEIRAGAGVIGMNVARAMQRFEKFGGISRYVFKDNVSYDDGLQVAIGDCDLQEFFNHLGKPEALTKESHKLFQYIVDMPHYRTYKVDFASPYVRGQLVKRLTEYEVPLLRMIGLAASRRSVCSSIRADIYEALGHKEIPKKGSTFQMRSLEQSTTNTSHKLPFLEPLLVEVPYRLSDIVEFQSGVYYYPIIRTEGAVDAVVKFVDCAYGFQMTTGSRHSIHQTKLLEIIKAIGVDETKFSLVFVVPRNRFEGWGKQKIEDPPKREKKDKKISPNAMPAELMTPPPPPHIQQFVLELPWEYGTPLEEQVENKI